MKHFCFPQFFDCDSGLGKKFFTDDRLVSFLPDASASHHLVCGKTFALRLAQKILAELSAKSGFSN